MAAIRNEIAALAEAAPPSRNWGREVRKLSEDLYVGLDEARLHITTVIRRGEADVIAETGWNHGSADDFMDGIGESEPPANGTVKRPVKRPGETQTDNG